MKKINKKGFTLIELLAVIVVLAIVLVVTIPSVLSSMKDARAKQFENAAASVKEWFEKQYEALKLGEEYTSNEFRNYLDEVCKDEADDKKAECRKLTTYKPLTLEVIEAAGLDPNDIDYENSFVAFSDNGKAEVNLVTTPVSKFSNGTVITFNTASGNIDNIDTFTNLFDLSKKSLTTTMPANEIYSADNYYYPVSSVLVQGTIANNSAVEFDNNNITLGANNVNENNMGVFVFFGLVSGGRYKLSFDETEGTVNAGSKTKIYAADTDGKLVQTIYSSTVSTNVDVSSNATHADITFTVPQESSGLIGILFYKANKANLKQYSNISLTRVL